MSEKHLGLPIDIHGGGQDLIFPHHENEIAQSECAHEAEHKAFVRTWVHNGHVMVEGEKMSKSLGNFYTVRQLLDEGWPGEVIRLVLLKTHYRAPLNFSRAALEEAKAELDGLYNAVRLHIGGAAGGAVEAALADDLNTPLALSELHKQPGKAAGAPLGLLQADPEAWFKAGVTDTGDIEHLIDARNAARKAKNFAEADRIRDLLKSRGIALDDRAGGVTEWKRA
jgi:cysteinyl-tRNA synthetase